MRESDTAAETGTTISSRVHERNVGPCRLITLQTPVEDVVSFRGSFLATPDFLRGEELIQDVTVSLLDKGTRKRDRFEIADFLDYRGAQLHFSSNGLYVRFSGRVLREDIADVLTILAEQLIEPLFDEEEFIKAKVQQVAAYQHAMDNTGSQAAAALSRRLYAEAHPNYIRPAGAEIERLGDITLRNILDYHESHFSANGLVLVLVGDVDEDRAVSTIEQSFGAWLTRVTSTGYERDASPQEVGRTEVLMPDKSNVDVRLGHALSVLRQDPDYLPLYVGNFVLGGNFSARLMATVRDEMGLTYGIHSGLSGITTNFAGHWNVSVTLSQGTVDQGIEATMDQVRRFVADGITADELDEKKTTIIGSFQVGLGTTNGLAGALLNAIEQGFGVDYLDRYPLEIDGLTLDQVNTAIRKHLHPEQMQTALAGTF